MSHTLTPIAIPPLSLHPPQLGLPGLRLGTPFESHADALEQLALQGYDAAPARLATESSGFLLERKVNSSDFEVALSFEYSSGRLASIESILACEVRDAPDALAMLSQAEAALKAHFGVAGLEFHGEQEWVARGIGTQIPLVAAGFFWSNELSGRTHPAQADGMDRFLAALEKLALPGAVAICTAIKGILTISTTVYDAAASPHVRSSLPSFLRSR